MSFTAAITELDILCNVIIEDLGLDVNEGHVILNKKKITACPRRICKSICNVKLLKGLHVLS